jgi:excinuclease ABC subunit B
VLYADKMTDSMRAAIDETNRRRARQQAFNEAHGITPQGIRKAVMDIMEGAYAQGRAQYRRWARVAEDAPDALAALPPAEVAKRIRELEEQMYRCARDLEFEEAARLRDEIRRIRALGLEIPETEVIPRKRTRKR